MQGKSFLGIEKFFALQSTSIDDLNYIRIFNNGLKLLTCHLVKKTQNFYIRASYFMSSY